MLCLITFIKYITVELNILEHMAKMKADNVEAAAALGVKTAEPKMPEKSNYVSISEVCEALFLIEILISIWHLQAAMTFVNGILLIIRLILVLTQY